jgi:acyl-CoA synthetase (AMP-forming)/AMP-acid ligase II
VPPAPKELGQRSANDRPASWFPSAYAKDFCEAIEKERINYTVLVPTMINLFTEFAENNRSNVSSLEVLAYGGSPMQPELIRRSRRLLPNVKLVQVYGLSETGFLTVYKIKTIRMITSHPAVDLCPGIEIQVTDELGNPVEGGQKGELVARGSNVMRGYWNNREETTAAFRNGFFRTGDVGYQDVNGYFYIFDRQKDMIVTGGENVYCGEVEAVIFNHPAVREAAVFGIPDPKWESSSLPVLF